MLAGHTQLTGSLYGERGGAEPEGRWRSADAAVIKRLKARPETVAQGTLSQVSRQAAQRTLVMVDLIELSGFVLEDLEVLGIPGWELRDVEHALCQRDYAGMPRAVAIRVVAPALRRCAHR